MKNTFLLIQSFLTILFSLFFKTGIYAQRHVEDFGMYYKALILKELGCNEEAKIAVQEAIKYFKKGFYMNEDNEFYSNYPKQVRVYEMEDLISKL